MFRVRFPLAAMRPRYVVAALFATILIGPLVARAAAAPSTASTPAPQAAAGASSAVVKPDTGAKTDTAARPEKKARFKGVVQDEKLQPLAGATVTVAVVPM